MNTKQWPQSFKSLSEVQHDYSDTHERHRARGLSRMAWGTAVATLLGMLLQFADRTSDPWFYIANYPMGKNQTAYLLICALSLVNLAVIVLFLNRGRLERASVVYVGLLFGIALLAYVPNQLTSSIMLVFSLPVIAAGALLDSRGVALTVAITVCTLIILLILEETDVLVNITTGTPLLIEAIGYGIIILVVDGAMLSFFAGGQRALLRHNLAVTRELETAMITTNEANAERERLQQEAIEAQQQALEAQRQTLQELSTPIIPIMDRILVMPLVGSIDSMRAKDIMRALLAGIRAHHAQVVIIDITGVPVVDSGVANHLHKTIQAARLKGAHTIVTGISDAVAEAVVELGIDWDEITTLSNLQRGLVAALNSMGIELSHSS